MYLSQIFVIHPFSFILNEFLHYNRQSTQFIIDKKSINTLLIMLYQKLSYRLLLLIAFLVVSEVSKAQSDPTGKSAVTSTYAIINTTIIPSQVKK